MFWLEELNQRVLITAGVSAVEPYHKGQQCVWYFSDLFVPVPTTGHSYDLPHMYMTSNAQTHSTNDYCQTWNRENYRTFDNKLYKFISRCTYIFAKDCIHQTFSIYTTNKQDCIDGQRCTTDIDIYIGMDHALSLSRNNHTTTVSHSRLSHLDYRYIFPRVILYNVF